MSKAYPKLKGLILGSPIRVVVLFNFLLVVVLFSLGNEAKKHEAFFRSILTDPVVLAVQLWVVGSTLLASGLFVWQVATRGRSEGTTPGSAVHQSRLDGMLLLAWWLVLVGICGYFYMLGLGS